MATWKTGRGGKSGAQDESSVPLASNAYLCKDIKRYLDFESCIYDIKT